MRFSLFSTFLVLFLLTEIDIYGSGLKPDRYNSSYFQNPQDHIYLRVLDSITLMPLNGVEVATNSIGEITFSKNHGTAAIPESWRNSLITISKPGYKVVEFMLDSTYQDNIEIILPRITRREDHKISLAPENNNNLMDFTSSINKIYSSDIENSTDFNVYDLTGKERGMNIYHAGIIASSPASMGFGTIGNSRMLQMVDGVNFQLPFLGYSIGSLIGPSDLDIESIEILPMGSTAIYGPGAMNGTIKINTKDPWHFSGFSAQAKLGSNLISTINGRESTPIYQFDMRYAVSKTLNKPLLKGLGFKSTFSYMETEDWQARGYDNINLTGNQEAPRLSDPGYNGANAFGDEFRFLVPFGIQGSDEIITRSGYHESYLLDYTAKSTKFNFGLYWKITNDITASLEFEPNKSSTVFSGSSRVELPDMQTNKVKFSTAGKYFSLTYYKINREIGRSFDTNLLGRNLNLLVKDNTSWMLDYTAAWGGAIPGVTPEDHVAARNFANGVGLGIFGNPREWLRPDDPIFRDLVNQIINNEIQGLNNLPVQSEFQGESIVKHLEFELNLSSLIKIINFKLGYFSRISELSNIDNLIYPNIDFNVNNQSSYKEIGFSMHISKAFFDKKLFLEANVRSDQRTYVETQTSSIVGISYQLSKNLHLRASFRNGFRNPSFTEQFVFRDIGASESFAMSHTLRGGLTELENALINPNGFPSFPLPGNTIFLKNVNAFEEAVTRSVLEDGIPSDIAKQTHIDILGAGILRFGDLLPIVAETNQSYEIGLRSKIGKNLFVDLSYIYSQIDNHIGQTGVVRPITVIPPIQDTLGIADVIRDDRTRQVIFYYQNARNQIETHNGLFGFDLYLNNGYKLKGNGRYALAKHDKTDIIDAAFNTPEYSANLTLENQGIFENMGFGIDYHWQDEFHWNSPMGEGKVKQFSYLNAQINYFIPNFNLKIKLGATNLLRKSFVDNLGGPEIGTVYYLSFRVEDLFD